MRQKRLSKTLIIGILLIINQITLAQSGCGFTDFNDFNTHILGQEKYDWMLESKAIVKIVVWDGNRSVLGTGFLINNNSADPYQNPLLLTAGHIFDTNKDDKIEKSEAANTDITFQIACKIPNSGGTEICYPENFTTGDIISIHYDKYASDYDFALVRIHGTISPDTPLLALRPFDNTQSPEILSLHHPDGKPMKVTLATGLVINNDGVYYTFNKSDGLLSEMIGGSSGAPWFSKNTRVPLGIHKGADATSCTDGISIANRISEIWSYDPKFGPRIKSIIGNPSLRNGTAFPTYVKGRVTTHADMNSYILHSDDEVHLEPHPVTGSSRIAYSEIIAKKIVLSKGVTITSTTKLISDNIVRLNSRQQNYTYTENKTEEVKKLLFSNDQTQLYPVIFPNPGRRMTIRLENHGIERIQIRVINMQGQELRNLDQSVSSGLTELTWDGKDKNGYDLPAGNYLVRIHSNEGFSTLRVQLN